MTAMEQVFWGAVLAAGLCGSAFCSGVETGFYTMNRVRLTVLAARVGRGGRSARRLRWLTQHPEQVIATTLIGNNLSNNLTVLGLTVFLEARGMSDAAMILLNVFVVTPLLLIFCESLPKETFRRAADRVMHKVVLPLEVARLLLTVCGLLPLLLALTRGVSRLVRVAPEKAMGHREEFEHLLREGASLGQLSASQQELLDRALMVESATVAQHMVPWRDVTTIRHDWDRARLMRLLIRAPFKALPVVDLRGRTVGVVSHMDAYLNAGADARALTRPVVTLAPSESVAAALLRLRAKGGQIAVVEVEGRPVGVVSLGRLLEPLVGAVPAA